MASIDEALSAAVRHHESGRLSDAEQMYRQILAVQPHQPDALHLLGVVALQNGQSELAVDYIARAIGIQGSQAVYHHHLGRAYQALGRHDDARASLGQALRLNPDLAPAHFQLGMLEHDAGRCTTAAEHYERALRLQPELIEARVKLADALVALGRLDEAVAAYRATLRGRPDCIEALHNMGAALVDLERCQEAVECLQRVIALQPGLAEGHYSLGRAWKGLGQRADAIACFQRALEVRPDFALAQYTLANTLYEQDDLESAAAAYRKALSMEPNDADTLANYGKVLHRLGNTEEALEFYNRAIQRKPDLAVAHFNRAVLFNELGQPDEALELSRAALAFDPNPARLYGNIAVALHFQGRAAEAIEYYRRAVAVGGGSAPGHSNLLFALNFSPDYDAPTIFAEHLAWAARHAEPLTALAGQHSNDPTPERRLRIGYVSAHFKHHAVNYFTEPILLAHDHDQFEIYCYSDVAQPDAITERIQAAADVWHPTARASAEEIVQMVRDDRIDILVDLAGHIGGNRLLVFARKPAPIQVTYIGYQNTTGMTAMDYRLTDERADPPGLTDRYYTERLVRLPRAFFCYKPLDEAPKVTPLPARDAGFVTFGSFNNLIKVTPQVIATWHEILARVPRSRLLVLANRGGYVERRLHELAAARGIDPTRIELFDKCASADYLRLQQRADIALDPFPFNGHTTTCDSIWMGLPVVMVEGGMYASRFGGSVLANVGLEDLIARKPSQYVDIAVALASDFERLTDLRLNLRARMAASPLLDHQGFTRNLESAYRRMWLDWCATRQKTS